MKPKKPKKPAVQYVHVIDKKTGKSVHAVKCDVYPAERVAGGLSINMSDEYRVAISNSPTDP